MTEARYARWFVFDGTDPLAWSSSAASWPRR